MSINIGETIAQKIGEQKDVEILKNVSASELTTFKGGGEVSFVVYPKNIEALKNVAKVFREYEITPRIIGKGANTIIDDDGIKIPMISLKYLNNVEIDGNKMKVGAGLSSSALLKKCIDEGMTGLEFLAGMPATVGGLVKMNAGACGEEIKNKIIGCEMLYEGSIVDTLPKFAYRKGEFIGILTSVTFHLDIGEKEEIQNAIKSNLQQRRQRQPVEPSCGSVFKSYLGKPAALYIEETGLKGTHIGGAQISKKHCNFIVNNGDATAQNFMDLVELIEDNVHYQLGAKLEREFLYLKEDTDEWTFR